MSPEEIDARDKIIASEARLQALEEAAALAVTYAIEHSGATQIHAMKIATAIRELKKGADNAIRPKIYC